MSIRTVKVGGVDDPIWDEPVSPVPHRRHSGHPFRTAMLVIAVILIAGACITWFVWPSEPAGGDPGGRVMKQLTPTDASFPGYGTASLPWVRRLPPSLDTSFIIKTEPFLDSCDGRAGTQGWSQVVVQSRFQWHQGLSALVAYMEPRLSELGWSRQVQVPQVPPGYNWTKSLNNGTRAFLNVTQEGGSGSTVWQADVIGQPVGKPASGC